MPTADVTKLSSLLNYYHQCQDQIILEDPIPRQCNRNCKCLNGRFMSYSEAIPISKVTILGCLAFLSACASVQTKNYVLELTGKPSTQCEITNDQKVVGTFTVPSTINFGSRVGIIEANCTLNNMTIVSQIQAADAQCQEQLVAKGPCPKPTSTVGSVEIIIRQSR